MKNSAPTKKGGAVLFHHNDNERQCGKPHCLLNNICL